ncbi:argininosuccinate lyase 1 [bacterium BMS3Bbin11]|nr:argininosuccinate lyase 1 [bacterium BMS3Abin11]GBE46278.1 argininosuccinate lyase 1 [bacterium BMS3Bbin11]GMT40831.1 MAG: argininosuccinate lyase [bacterium]HDH08854.1 argininosuccinate lyase [Gammaproteobacteria bacterium]HDH17223.1 argininosuccinate lyase [Gammaproteobacteria bacterium]
MTVKKAGKEEKPWKGRFTAATDQLVEEYTQSVSYDKRLYKVDIEGSKAHASMLARVGVLTDKESRAIIEGLDQILEDIERGAFNWSRTLEDVHMNIEARLTENIGDIGKKLHTGRSRNDQVATDIRLYLRQEIESLSAEIKVLIIALLDLAEKESDTIMPGFTHLQVAQPVTFGHHMMAWVEMLRRDLGRLSDCHRRMNSMPLGAAALAGTTFPIDRHYTAELLGFDAPAENSLDAVSDRDFAMEFMSTASVIMIHLSRMSEELIIWSSAQFGFIDISDTYCTGSSIMPQKKNPDVAELTRGKSGRVIGNLVSLLMIMKGQPLAYNRDNQEDKEPLFDSLDTVTAAVRVFAGMIPQLTVKSDAMYQAARQGFSTATDLADYLVRKNIPFRDAHEIVGKAVQAAEQAGHDLSGMSLDELRSFSDEIDKDVFDVLTLEGSVNARDHIGGTAPNQVRAAIKRARETFAIK